MPYLKTEAIALRRFAYSESSQIVSLLTRDHGRIRAIAKGAHRPKSAFGGPIDLAQRLSIVYWPKPPGTLDILASADLLDGYAGLRLAFRRTAAACGALELAEGLTPEGDPQPEIYDLLRRTLADLAGGAGPEASLLRFEARLLRELGHFPRTASCARCRRPVAGAPRVGFSPHHGGVLCPACPPQTGARLSASAGALALLESLGNGAAGHAPIPSSPPAPGPAGELHGLLGAFFAHLLEREPRARRFLDGP